MTFTHPETGEVLDSREEFEAAIGELDDRLIPIYRLRNEIRREWGERFQGPELPPPRARTPTQEKVARCPRCGSRIENPQQEEGDGS